MPWAEGAFKDPMKSNLLKLFAYASVKTEHWPKHIDDSICTTQIFVQLNALTPNT